MGAIVAQLRGRLSRAMNSSLVVQRFSAWRTASLPLALVTVYETAGSTYSKPGHRILMAPDGDFQGLVSGGCLEGDLAHHAADAVASGTAKTVTYDLRDEADELFGLGIGCNGLLRVLVQPMSADQQYRPFAAIADAMLGDHPAAAATVVDSAAEDLALGATLVRSGGASANFGIPDRLLDVYARLCEDAIHSGETVIVAVDTGSRVLVGPVSRVPRLLILGGGIDAVPLVTMAAGLGWRVSVGDHRPAYLQRSAFDVAEAVVEVAPGQLSSTLSLADFDAIVVMSHHLATDEAYLRELSDVACQYVGVLGPSARRRKLLDSIGATGKAFEKRLRGPVGFDLGADSPETIALSILAEVQQTLAHGQGHLRQAMAAR